MIDRVPEWLIDTPPQPPIAPSLADRVLVLIFIIFALYKAARLVKSTRLGWSFATYNVVLAWLFILALFILPFVHWSLAVEADLLTASRLALVVAILWCVFEVEASRKRGADDYPADPRRGHGQQT